MYSFETTEEGWKEMAGTGFYVSPRVPEAGLSPPTSPAEGVL